VIVSLYRLYDRQGALLYVGISVSALRRLSEHSQDKSWWDEVVSITLVRYPDRRSAEAAELWVIANEVPVHNVTGRSFDPNEAMAPLMVDLSRLAPADFSELRAWASELGVSGWLCLVICGIVFAGDLVWYAGVTMTSHQWRDPIAVQIYLVPGIQGALTTLALRQVLGSRPRRRIAPPVREYLMAAMAERGGS
jgi:hypothetical protein